MSLCIVERVGVCEYANLIIPHNPPRCSLSWNIYGKTCGSFIAWTRIFPQTDSEED